MPKYGFHVGSTFNPTSVEDYLRPGLAYVQTFKDYQNQYQALMDNTADLKKLAEMEGSVEAYATYDKYQKALTEAANNLATMGWSRDRDIKSAMDLRRQFTEDIVPIKEAYNTWKSMADEQRKNNPKGDLVYDTDFSNAGVDFFLKNPNPTYKAVSQAELEDTGFKEGKAYASRLPITLQQAQAFGSQYLEMRRLGASTQDALATLSNGDSELSQIVQQVYDSYGLNDGNNNYTDTQKEQLRDRIITGVLEGIIDDASLVSNKNWDLYEANYKARLAGNQSDDRIPLVRRVPLVTKNKETILVPLGNDGNPIFGELDESKFLKDANGEYVMNITQPISDLYLNQGKDGVNFVSDSRTGRPVVYKDKNGKDVVLTWDKNSSISALTGNYEKVDTSKPTTPKMIMIELHSNSLDYKGMDIVDDNNYTQYSKKNNYEYTSFDEVDDGTLNLLGAEAIKQLKKYFNSSATDAQIKDYIKRNYVVGKIKGHKHDVSLIRKDDITTEYKATEGSPKEKLVGNTVSTGAMQTTQTDTVPNYYEQTRLIDWGAYGKED